MEFWNETQSDMMTTFPADPKAMYGKGAESLDPCEYGKDWGPDRFDFWHDAVWSLGRSETSPRQGKGVVQLLAATVLFLLSALLPFAASAQQPPAPCKINVQSGTVAELALLPGVGEKTAALIAEAKPETLEALDQVKGIGVEKLSWITPYAVFGAEKTTCTEKQKRPEPAKDGAQ